MPIYEYECGKCRSRFEKRQGFHEDTEAVCPQCQGQSRRVFQSTPVVFKGSGFYVTDHRKGIGDKPAKAKPETAPKEEVKKKSDEGTAPAG